MLAFSDESHFTIRVRTSTVFVSYQALQPMLETDNLNRPQKFAYIALLICVGAGYVRLVTCSCKPGWVRLATALPVVCCNCFLPSIFSGELDAAVCTMLSQCQLWLCNLKILALCFGRGRLSRRTSPLQFLALYAAPLYSPEQTNPGKPMLAKSPALPHSNLKLLCMHIHVSCRAHVSSAQNLICHLSC